MAGQLQTVTQADFSGGINAVASPYLIGQKQVARARNLMLDEHGSLRTRDGYTIITSNAGLTGPVVYRKVLNRSDGASIPFLVFLVPDGSGGYSTSNVFRTDTDPWTLVMGLNDGPTEISPVPTSITINDTEVFASGYSRPRTWDGTTPGVIGGQAGQVIPPGAQHIAFHLGSVWIFNTSPVTTTLDGTSSLRMSDPNNFNSWPNTAQTFISKDDGQVGMGIATFTIAETGISPTQTLVAFKNFSSYQITGVLAIDGSGFPLFSVQRTKSDMGCIAPRTIQFVSGFGIIRLTHKGFALFNGVDDVLISEEIRPFIFGKDDISPINFSSAIRSYATQAQNPPLYVAACPVGSTSLTRIFIYDLVRRAWTIADYPVDFQTLALVVTPNNQPSVQAGNSTGIATIYSIFNGNTTDNGSTIAWSLRTRAYFLGSFLRPAYWRRLILDFAYTPDQDIMTTLSIAGLGSHSTTSTFAGSSGGARWGASIWGQFVWSGSSLVDGRQPVDIMKTASSVTADISGSGFVKLRGLEWQVRSKPLTRQVL